MKAILEQVDHSKSYTTDMMRRQIVLWGIRNAHRVEKLIAPVQQHVGSVEDYLRAILDGRIWGDTTLIGMYD